MQLYDRREDHTLFRVIKHCLTGAGRRSLTDKPNSPM